MKLRAKNTFFLFLLFLTILATDSIAQKNWYRGNTHTHTTYSDGKLTPTGVVSLYKNEGYQFLFITDHGKVAPFDEAQLSTSTFLCFRGEESETFHHLSCLNIDRTINSVYPPQVVDSVLIQGGFLVVNHPMRGNHEVYARDIWDVDGYTHIEILNAKSEKDGYHDNQSLWDSLLTAGNLIYGVASDDMHETKHLAKGWIMVQADMLQRDSIVRAIKQGDFYSSTGAGFSRIEVKDDTINIVAPNATKIDFIGNNRTLLKTVNNDSAIYVIQGDEGYVRVQIIDTEGKRAWTQPLFWNKTSQVRKADTTVERIMCQGQSEITKEGIYYETEESTLGTDSIIKIHAFVISEPAVFRRNEVFINLGETVTIAPLFSYEKYMWSTGDTVRSVEVSGNSVGDVKMWLRIKQSACYFTDTLTVHVIDPTLVTFRSTTPVAIYPNPANTFVVLESGGVTCTTAYELFTANGSKLQTGTFKESTTLDISELNQGVYCIQLNTSDGIEKRKLIVIR